ncbi:MAG: aminodeoxychorismate synthase component I [Woeseiaceae bacterium]|nr:aminodeoxychorismate synthase component I [Woeseiaceae bacterium]
MSSLISDISGADELRKLNQVFPDRYPFLLQSTACSSDLGRYDILFAFPEDSLVLEDISQLVGKRVIPESTFLESLDAWWLDEKTNPNKSHLPFHGGWFLYLGYELAAEIECSLNLKKDPLLPVAFAVRCPAALIYDHQKKICVFINENNCPKISSSLQVDIEALDSMTSNTEVEALAKNEDDPAQYTSAVINAKKYIQEGDIYQANLSRKWTVQISPETSAEAIYRKLCATNPAPFSGIAHWNGTSIISSSPERLICIDDGEVSTRPIAGTRRRGGDEIADNSLSSELFNHPKELAEHVMLIDLERNDLGRICIPGSVKVDEMMVLESYAHVHHIVSSVQGKLRKEVSPGDSIAAVFPGGTITGCPKIRCMQIIDELEYMHRGAYTGSFGFLNRDGSLDLNILIRTMVKHGDEVTFRAGAGIVAESDSQAELDETRAKAEGMLRVFKDD